MTHVKNAFVNYLKLIIKSHNRLRTIVGFFLYKNLAINEIRDVYDCKRQAEKHLSKLLQIEKTETPIFQGISVVLPKLYLGGRDDRSRIIDPQCEWGIRIVLLAKNNILYRFLNAQTYRFDSSFSMHNKKGTLKGTFSAVVEMTGVEPAASTSRTWRATICATSRYFIVIL